MRIYMSEVGTPNTVEANELLLNIVSEAERVKETLDENGYVGWVVALHNNMRENMGLPNKIFSIRSYEDNTKAEFIFFDIVLHLMDKNKEFLSVGDTVRYGEYQGVLLYNHHYDQYGIALDYSMWYGDDKYNIDSYGKFIDIPMDNGARMEIEKLG